MIKTVWHWVCEDKQVDQWNRKAGSETDPNVDGRAVCIRGAETLKAATVSTASRMGKQIPGQPAIQWNKKDKPWIHG